MSFLRTSARPIFQPKVIFLILTILATMIYIWPELNYQDRLAQGDHGRDLYAFEAVLKGQLPYKDFWWVYGPAMPYYYGLFYKVFGFHITSILLGRAVLLVACAAFFYLSCAVIMDPSLAFLGAVWFIQGRQEFICTYNHIGGTLASLVIIYALLSYIYSGSVRFLWTGLIAAFLLLLIKINFGVVSLLGIFICMTLTDRTKRYPWDNRKKKFCLTALTLVPLATLLIYGYLLNSLPFYAIRQCMPYLGDDQPYHASPIQALHDYFHGFWFVFRSTSLDTCIGLVLHLSTLVAIWLLLAGKIARDHAKNIWLSLGLVGMFFVLYFHEYLFSNVYYRSSWSYPFLIFFHFIMIATVFRVLHPVGRALILAFFWVLMVSVCVNHIIKVQSQKTPDHFLSMDRGQIYVGNEPQWVDTVNKTTAYLDNDLSKDALFFALPYDCLYYYLTARPSPTRQLIFFDHLKIPLQQELSVIKELENNHVNDVLISTRMASWEQDLGFFGKTYCPLLAKYLGDNFTQVYNQGGDLQRNPGWADNHGVFILKRN